MITRKTHTLDVPCTPAQLAAYEAGALLQDAMPDVPKELREFVKTGITPEEWDATFKEDDTTT
jgi:hypothetical protein